MTRGPGARGLLLLSSVLSPVLDAPAQDSPRLAVGNALLAAFTPAADDPDARFADLVSVATAQARSAAAQLLLLEAQRQVPLLRNPGQAVRALQAFVDASPHGLSARAARRMQFQCLERIDPEAARDRRPYEDLARNLVAIGPFGDGGDEYTGVPFPPELDFPVADAVVEGRFGPLRTRVVRRLPGNRMMSLADPADGRGGCFYALHRIQVDDAVSAYLEITCDGSFQVFLNGAEVGRVNRNLEPSPNTRFFPIPLRRGRNHLLVKTNTVDRDRIALRYLDGAGRTLPGIREIPADAEILGWSEDEAPPVAEGFADPFTVLRSGRRGLEGEELAALRVAIALAAFRTGRIGDGVRTLWDLEREPPAEARTQLALAVAVQSATTLPIEMRRSRARQLVEGIGDRLGNHHGLLMERVTLLVDEDRGEEAVRLLQGEVDAGRAGPETFSRLHGILAQLRFGAEARRLVDAWADAVPTDTRAVLLQATARIEGGDSRGALALLRGARARLPDASTVARRILELALDLGEEELYLETLTALHHRDPASLAALRDRAALAHRMGHREQAEETLRSIAAHAKADASALRWAADRLYELGDEATALSAYRRSLGADPSQHRLRRLLARLQGTELFPTMARFRRDGDAARAAFRPGERESKSASTLVLDQMIVQVLEDGSMVQETHELRRINDLRGVERYQSADRAAGADEVVILRTISVDGDSYVPNRVSGGFSMPRLEPGAFVEWIVRDYTGTPGAGPWRIPVFLFQSDQEAHLLSELVVILPPEPRGSFRIRGFSESPEAIPLEDGRRAYVFERRDMPRLEIERLALPLQELAPLVTFGEDRELSPRARRAHGVAMRRSFVTPYIEAKAAEITAGLEGDLARLEAIHDFAHEQIPDGGNTTDPTAILLRGQGARFFLEVALILAADIPFQHALTSVLREDLQARPEPLFLGEERYELPALLVRPRDGTPQWLFAGSPRYSRLGEIPSQRLGAGALLLEEGKGTLTRLPDGDRVSSQGFRVAGIVTVQEGGDALIRADLTLRGALGLDAAEQIRNLEETIQEAASRQLITGVLEGWTLRQVELVDQRPGAPLRLRGELSRPGALRPAGNSSLLPLPLLPGSYMSSLGDRGGRVHPMRISETTSASWEIAIDPGESHRFVEVPDAVQVHHGLLDFSLSFQMRGPVLVVRRELYQKPGTIPANRFDEWLTLLRKLDQAEAVNLRLARRRP